MTKSFRARPFLQGVVQVRGLELQGYHRPRQDVGHKGPNVEKPGYSPPNTLVIKQVCIAG